MTVGKEDNDCVAVWQEWRHNSAAGITEGTAVGLHCMARRDVTQVTHTVSTGC